jgi:o-succinylbenzoate synthase
MSDTPVPAFPSLAELQESAHPFTLTLRARFRGVTQRQGLLLSGPVGWGEFAPFDDHDDIAAARWLAAAIEAGWQGWPAPVRTQVPVNLIVPATSAALASAMVRENAEATGCTIVKVKVADAVTSAEADIERVAAVRRALDDVFGSGVGRIRVDANGAWEIDDAVASLAVLDDVAGGLEYAEQPARSLDACAAIRERSAVAIAVDEAVRLAADPLDHDLHERIRAAADIVVVKAIPLGGVGIALDVVRRLGMTVVVSGSLDSSIGIASGVRLAASVPTLSHACGLGTGLLLATDLVEHTLIPSRGVIDVDAIATEPATEHLAAADSAMGAQDRQRWMDRLAAAYRALPGAVSGTG